MIDQIKKLRVQIDCIAQLTKELKPVGIERATFNNDKTNPKTINDSLVVEDNLIIIIEKQNSKEIEKSVDSLYLAKAWLGKVLGELGTTNPYGSGYKTKDDIVPTQDVAEFKVVKYDDEKHKDSKGIETNVFNNFNHIEKVDWLRTEIESLVKKAKLILFNDDIGTMFLHNVFTHLSEARFWLGFELERTKNEK